MNKCALIIGSEGQDGILLRECLVRKNYSVIGIGRKQSQKKFSQYDFKKFDLYTGDYNFILNILKDNPVDEVYYLAAYHQSSQKKTTLSIKTFDYSIGVNFTGFAKILEMVRNTDKKIKVFYASSSLIFGGSKDQIQTELTPPTPNCLYSIGKVSSMHLANYYRNEHGLFVSVGILYNHESVYRNDNFLSQKIIKDTRRLINNEINSIVIGNLDAITDWGYAADYVEAMWHLLQLSKPDEFIISSGEAHTVRDWFDILFTHLNIDWEGKVIEDQSLLTRKKPVLIGDNSKLLRSGWKAQTNFKEMVLELYNSVL